MAHPDDVDFGAGGTVAGWTAGGAEVVYLVVTDGDAGGTADGVPRAEIARVRRAEQLAAARCLGVADVRFLGYPDGGVVASTELRREIARAIREVRPDAVLTHSPERNYDRIAQSHPDHRAVGSATLDAVYPDARNPHAHPELAAAGLEPWTVPAVWLRGSPQPGHYVDITDTVDRKLAAIACHASQVDHLPDLSATIRDRLLGVAAAGGLPPGRLAESFQLVETG